MTVKKVILSIMLIFCVAAIQLSAFASDSLSGRIEGTRLMVSWSAECSGECTLTVYQNGWPICVRSVQCKDGGESIDLGRVSGRYSLRLRTAGGCLTADVQYSASKPEGTPKPTVTEAPTVVPTSATTVEPTPEATEAPNIAPTPEPTIELTPEPTIASTPVPTAFATPVAAATPKPTSTPIATRKPQATPVAAVNRDDLAAEVVRQTNEERAKLGLGALRTDGELTRAACVRAGEIAQSFSHTRPNGASWSTVSASAYGENIAMGQRTADRVMAAWMTSEGHRANILHASYGSIGVCAFVSGGVTYWVQLFGR